MCLSSSSLVNNTNSYDKTKLKPKDSKLKFPKLSTPDSLKVPFI